MSHRLSPDHVEALAEAFSAPADVTAGLRRLCDLAADVGGASCAAVLFAWSRGSPCQVVSTDPRARGLHEVQVATGQGPTIEALRTGTVVMLGAPSSGSRRWPAFAAAAMRAGFSTVCGVPLAAGPCGFGAIGLLCERAGKLSDASVADTRALAGLAAAMLAWSHRVESIRQVADQLRTALTTRVVIEQAKGRLAERDGCSPDAAFERLRRRARDRNQRIHALAEAVARGQPAR